MNVKEEHAGGRLDHFRQRQSPEYSRSRLQEWIKAGRVLVNGSAARASHTLRQDDALEVEPAPPAPLTAAPEAIPLDVLYEDSDLVAINKPAGMVVHAGAGGRSGTPVNAPLHRVQAPLTSAGDLRPGNGHRRARYTNGVLVGAKNVAAQSNSD